MENFIDLQTYKDNSKPEESSIIALTNCIVITNVNPELHSSSSTEL